MNETNLDHLQSIRENLMVYPEKGDIGVMGAQGDTGGMTEENTSNLNVLKKLTHKLTAIPEIVHQHQSGFVNMELDKGTCLGWKILIDKNTGIHKWFLSAGSVFPNHKHTAKEILVIYDGQCINNQDGQDQKCTRGDVVITEPGKEHSFYAITDTWVITVTIPVAEGFPQ